MGCSIFIIVWVELCRLMILCLFSSDVSLGESMLIGMNVRWLFFNCLWVLFMCL